MSIIEELENEYILRHRRSQKLYKRALRCFASGVTHDGRYAQPFPIYAVKADGSKKWDVDGNEYVDYVMGHGSLLFGYGNQSTIKYFQKQIQKGIHLGTSTELEIEWAELIKDLVPCAKDGFVRACGCGGEAVMMAIRLSRIYTGKTKIVVQAGSYHGKGDSVVLANHGPPFGELNVQGIPKSVKDNVIIVPFNNLKAVEDAFSIGDISCFLMHCNNLYDKEYIQGLRKLTKDYDVVFIMDEVISGFRYACGGAQEYYGVIPDLAVLGKIIGGGAPVGAICGKKEIMEFHAFKRDLNWNRFTRISVGGTWNAQPISIIGGIAMLKTIYNEHEKIYPRIYSIGKRLTNCFNNVAEDMKVSAWASGMPFDNPTMFKLNFFNKKIPSNQKYLWKTGPRTIKDYFIKQKLISQNAKKAHYLCLSNCGVHAMNSGLNFFTCTEYTEEDLLKTEAAFKSSLGTQKKLKLSS
jgi:glutamate-1-semialdehyde 2,1-aminomutase